MTDSPARQALDGRSPSASGIPDRRGLPRWVKIVGITVLVVAVGLYGGYRYLLTTEYGVFFTLFADDHRAENFRSMDEIFPSRDVLAGDDTWAFETDDRPLPSTYTFEGDDHDLERFLERTETTGLVVVHEDRLVHEEYRRGNDAQSRATSWSMAKSMVAALVGIAIEDGHLDGLDEEVVAHLPGLAGSGYDGVTVRDLLTMSSGVDFDEGYDSTFADVNMIFLRSMALSEPMLDYAGLERIREPGTYNDYLSSDSGVLAATLAAATGQPIAQYLQEEIWQPAGMEGDAFWSTDRTTRRSGSAASTPNCATTPASAGSTSTTEPGTAARSSQTAASSPRPIPRPHTSNRVTTPTRPGASATATTGGSPRTASTTSSPPSGSGASTSTSTRPTVWSSRNPVSTATSTTTTTKSWPPSARSPTRSRLERHAGLRSSDQLQRRAVRDRAHPAGVHPRGLGRVDGGLVGQRVDR